MYIIKDNYEQFNGIYNEEDSRDNEILNDKYSFINGILNDDEFLTDFCLLLKQCTFYALKLK